MEPIGSMKRLFGQHSEILFAYLYGSVAREENYKGSDVDIAIFVKEDFTPCGFYEVNIAEEIERTGLKNVEVVILNGKSLRFLNQVLRYGKLIFSRDEQARVSFETKVTKRYIDFKPYYEEYDKMRMST
ncbi:MAG: nucleotidyltransferase domain-containing protein [Candidatus Thermoplasmatota archaeon]|nr:nucleotidyltransferase domain-containing protein [Candidatus Thermoplasmatota archaeon]